MYYYRIDYTDGEGGEGTKMLNKFLTFTQFSRGRIEI